MTKSSRLQEDKIIEENIIKDMRNLFRLKKENKTIKYRILRGMRNLF